MECPYRQSWAAIVILPKVPLAIFVSTSFWWASAPSSRNWGAALRPPESSLPVGEKAWWAKGIWEYILPPSQGLTNVEYRSTSMNTQAPSPRVSNSGTWPLCPRLPFGTEAKPPSKVGIPYLNSTPWSHFLSQPTFHVYVSFFCTLCFWETDLRHRSSLPIVRHVAVSPYI